MISGGNTTVTVSSLQASVEFYTAALGLKLTNRFGDHWATLSAGPSYWTTDDVGAGLIIGLHPSSPLHPAPGTKGAVTFGLETYEPIDGVVSRLSDRGVRMTSEIVRFEAGNSVGLEDPDGNSIYLWEITPNMLEEKEAAKSEGGPREISGGHATVYVSNMDAAVGFYSEVLGLKLTNRYGDKWATVEADRSLVIGLHPRSARAPAPGTKGGMRLGLEIDEPIERVVSRLAQRGVRLTGGIVRSDRGNAVGLEDADGNAIDLRDAAAADSRETGLASTGSAVRRV